VSETHYRLPGHGAKGLAGRVRVLGAATRKNSWANSFVEGAGLSQQEAIWAYFGKIGGRENSSRGIKCIGPSIVGRNCTVVEDFEDFNRMNEFTGKKVLCFIALPHHNRFLVPIMNGLRSRGMDVVYFTAAAEGAFEITLNQAKLPYRHLLDYSDAETRSKVEAAYRYLRPIYQEKILGSRTFQAVPVVIQDKTIRPTVENVYCLMRMLEVEKPDLLFALHELNPWGKMLGYLSHTYQIPYFTLQEGLYYADVHYYRFHTDF
jgi:hypothetical protein